MGEEAAMSGTMSRLFDRPDELRTPEHASVAVVDLEGSKVARFTLEPGWRWSESIKPIAGTDTCQAHHLGVLTEGTMGVRSADGTESEFHPGEAYVIEPGHDAWVVGNTPVVAFEFDSPTAEHFAARPS
jgi:hypothetical protein